MKVGLTISSIGHAIVLLWGLVSLMSKPLIAVPIDAVDAELVSATELSQLRAGTRNAPNAEAPKPLVEKIAAAKPVENTTAKVVEKPKIMTPAAEASPPAESAPKVSEQKPPAPTPPRAEPKPQEVAKSDPDPPPDAIAEALAKDAAKKPEAKKTEAKKPEPPKKQEAKPARKFDATRIAALLDRRDPERQEAAGDAINRVLALGAATGDAPQLSASEISLLVVKLKHCWDIPVGVRDADKLRVPITIRFKPDGTLASPPQPEIRASDAQMQAMIDSVVRAFIKCQPYTMLSPSKYETWKELPFLFDPKGMFGG
jgi:hypothetical protein